MLKHVSCETIASHQQDIPYSLRITSLDEQSTPPM